MSFKKFKILDIPEIEKMIIHWALSRKYSLVFYIFVAFVLFISSSIPYLNLIYNPHIATLVSLGLMPIILDIDSKVFFFTGIVCFLVTLLLWFVGQTEEADTLAEYIFMVLLAGSLKALVSGK